MTTRRERKRHALAEVKAAKQNIKRLPASERRLARKALRAEWRSRRRELRGLPRGERARARRAIKVEKKLYHRPRRFIAWAVAAVLVAVLAFAAAPFVGVIKNLLSLEIDSSSPEALAARTAGSEVSARVAEEGIVLLTNDDGALPLSGDRINVFGFESFNLRYGGAGSGAANLSEATTLYESLAAHGITPNADLIAVHEDAGAQSSLESSPGVIGLVKALLSRNAETEPAPDHLTPEVLAAAREHSATALIVIGNDGAEASDFTPEQLRLTANQRALLERVTGAFDDVIVVVNSGNQMELGFLEEYPQITAALNLGTPGPYGAEALARILTGEVNPSGRLTVTYAYDVESAPATANFGDFRYSNANRAFLDYEEGIYVGYRFYETYYDDEDAYGDAVQFPFGHGLSYSTFEWDAPEPRLSDGTIAVDVAVTNTGQVAGKDVVQVYVSVPHTPGGPEKSAIELVGYAKTALLDPGETQELTVEFEVRDLASWSSPAGGYILDAGSYEIAISTDVHSPVLTHVLELEQQTFTHDGVTGVELATRFADVEGDLTYLSRADWQGTFPTTPEGEREASAELLAAMDPVFAPAPGGAPAHGQENGLRLDDLTGVPMDDPRWGEFLEQLTVDEQIDLFIKGAWQTTEVERLGIPTAVLLDGPAGLNYFFGSFEAAAYPTEVVVAATWNDDLARAVGEAVGEEAAAYGVQGWYAPGMNLHRSALGGRNFEYFSEDPLLSGRMGANMVKGAQDRGITVFMKHFVLNDQEINARSGVNVWVAEQALRELYLRPFEIAVKEGGATGAMSSFIHLGPRWAGGHDVLLGEVLRGEWGFEGLVTSDAVLGGFMNAEQAARAGNDIMLTSLVPGGESSIREALDADPAGVGRALRDRVHQILYMVANSSAMEP